MIERIIPTPKKSELTGGNVCCSLCVSAPERWSDYVNAFCDAFNKLFDTPLTYGEGGIELVCDASVEKGGYIYDSREGIKLIASDGEGICYALATALQIVTVDNGCVCSESAVISDKADKDYRAVMVDLARQWHPARHVLKYIDICFLMKIKYLHLHFIDDQAYTLPSKAFPDITKGCRSYSYDELDMINAYAKSRGIVIIPEFEAPGHAGFLVRNYLDVFANDMASSNGAEIVTESGAVITAKNIVCAGKTETMDGIKTLLREMCEMFPDSPYIHIGGDEANIKAWNYCSHCVEYMKQNDIADEYALYSDFVAKVAQAVIDMGRTPIVWEGFPKDGADKIPRETVVIAWESHYHMADDLVKEGFNIINASWQPLYIVPSPKHRWGIKEIMAWNVYNWQHWWEHSKARLNPINLNPTEQVLGAQLCAWEQTYERDINFVMENTAALSERTWNVERLHDDDEFLKRHRSLMKLASKLIQDI